MHLKKTFKKLCVTGLAMAMAFVGAGALQVQAEEPDERITLVLDAGHGGHDPGAVDPVNGYAEADLAQQLTNKLALLFTANESEVNVVTTKDDAGSFLSIDERAAVANANNADLFVSMHLNAAERDNARGFQVFPAVPGRTHHEESMRAAEAIVAHVREIGYPMVGTNGIYYAFYKGSEKLFYDSTTYNGENNSRGSFGVLEGADCPALLVENWFITNAEDMALFNSEQGTLRMALYLYRGICEYFGIEAQF